MALMATADCFEKEDLAGKVIPAMSICLVDRERSVSTFLLAFYMTTKVGLLPSELCEIKATKQSKCSSENVKRSLRIWCVLFGCCSLATAD